ncbi:efflux RND transporter periplasmic adaptor subunit [Alkalimarinus alittae]|uniref:Efflux RND transporter periplasmic adaptor subunit n=1 Tax=Alkalimarinus alittae TaxID=2961619 RepID=A0ABY6MZV8_9ALTE|nr:efflux RND transporter periplasmic adaptor subunit [Alkalimarinus alittae]UZE95320.1 efflux RND transporter periplasmic adaptor subunit [Alkalimarinus alittae]
MKRTGILFAMIIALGGGVALQKFVLSSSQLPILGDTDHSASASAPDTVEKKPLYWVAPMDKNYRRDKPGQSPMGMDLVPVYEDDAQGGDEGTVKISPMVINNLGVRTEEVTKGSMDLSINTVGYIDFDEDKLSHIHSRVDGWIEVLNVNSSGDAVTKGQTLYELYSPALVNAQEEYLAVIRSGNKTLKKASRSRLLSLGLSNHQVQRLEQRKVVDQRIKVIADRDGFVKDLNVREGMFIKPATEVMSIGSLDSVWVIAEVFERQSSWVKAGQRVEMKTEALPGKQWSGEVDYLYPVLDSKTRTLRVRIRVSNPEIALKPNMYTELTLFVPVSDEALSIPREALIKGGTHNRVVTALGDGMFKSVLVDVGIESNGRVQIMKGLSEGDIVVTSAQFLIDSESNIDAEIARMESREIIQHEQSESASNLFKATGKIEDVMADMAMLTITHDPIKALDWPTMRMDFEVADDIDVNAFEAGQLIEFELKKQGDWDYLITTIKPVKTQ